MRFDDQAMHIQPFIPQSTLDRTVSARFVIGVRDGVVIRVDFFPNTNPDGSPHKHAGKISTAYPTNTPENP